VSPAPAAVREVQSAVLDWYAEHGRDLAFRRTRDPWAILVSEVMAQQTQAARAAGHWTRFMARFPTPTALARSTDAAVIREWRGLGYNRRAVALRAAAARIVEQHGGAVPDDLEALEALPGVGPYTARAVLAFAFDRPIAPLDTNIRRVLDRALGPLPSGPRALQSTADGFVPVGASAAWSHALMDLGATLCVAREPRCGACPIRAWCRTSTGDPAGPSVVRSPASRTGRASKPFPATTRWLRGRILDRLRDADDGRWVELSMPIGQHAAPAVAAALDQLHAEGMIERPANDPSRARLRAS
jgi:A/G-specific adenine glycosylase